MREETEASGLGEAGKEDSCHTGAAVDATQSSLLNEGGKKDPLTRRRELLVNSGLAEVNTFYFLIHSFSSSKYIYGAVFYSQLSRLSPCPFDLL